jgi:hypothetical protein
MIGLTSRFFHERLKKFLEKGGAVVIWTLTVIIFFAQIMQICLLDSPTSLAFEIMYIDKFTSSPTSHFPLTI